MSLARVINFLLVDKIQNDNTNRVAHHIDVRVYVCGYLKLKTKAQNLWVDGLFVCEDLSSISSHAFIEVEFSLVLKQEAVKIKSPVYRHHCSSEGTDLMFSFPEEQADAIKAYFSDLQISEVEESIDLDDEGVESGFSANQMISVELGRG